MAKQISKEFTGQCSRCNRSVTMKYVAVQQFASELADPVDTTLDHVASYGRCGVAVGTNIARFPFDRELSAKCPIYQQIKARP